VTTRRALAALSLVLSALVAVAAWTPVRADFGQPLPADGVVLEDAIAVEILDREVIAFDLTGSGRLSTRLEKGEQVLFQGARGRVAVVLTTNRILGATPASSSWQVESYRIAEDPVAHAELSQSLAVVLTSQRALALFGTGNWTEQSLGPRETVVDVTVGPGTAVVVTNRRALGVSAQTGGFFEAKLRLDEDIEAVNAISGLATVTTSERTLLFKGPSGLWTEQSRPLR
jgi:hypothetical protein